MSLCFIIQPNNQTAKPNIAQQELKQKLKVRFLNFTLKGVGIEIDYDQVQNSTTDYQYQGAYDVYKVNNE